MCVYMCINYIIEDLITNEVLILLFVMLISNILQRYPKNTDLHFTTWMQSSWATGQIRLSAVCRQGHEEIPRTTMYHVTRRKINFINILKHDSLKRCISIAHEIFRECCLGHFATKLDLLHQLQKLQIDCKYQ